MLWSHGPECVPLSGACLFRKDTNTMDQSVSPNLFRKGTRHCDIKDKCVSLSSIYLEKAPYTEMPWTSVCLLEQ